MTRLAIPVLAVAPAEAPVSLAEAKAHLRIESGEDDALITGLITAATARLDGWRGELGRALVTQTWRIDRAAWCDVMRLPLAPVASATIAYTDADGVSQALGDGVYRLFEDAVSPYLRRIEGAATPALATAPDAVQITFVAGYGNAAAVPAAIRQAILMLVGHLYGNREALADGAARTELPFGVKWLLGSHYRVGV